MQHQTQYGKKIKSDPLKNELGSFDNVVGSGRCPRANRPGKVKFDIKCSRPFTLIIYTVTKRWVK